MYDNTVDRDYIKTELQYRLGRARADLAGRRRRRLIARHGTGGEGTWTSSR